MLFNSVEFIIFFPFVTLLYFAVPKKYRYIWLLAASYYFYMAWSVKYAFLLLFSTSVTYASGILLDHVPHRFARRQEAFRKGVVAGSFILNLGILFFYKYVNFAEGLIVVFLRKFNISLSYSLHDIVLPVGISFFTFQALSYTADVYRKVIPAERNFFRYALFVSFFPQLVAGPIERPKKLLAQLAQPADFRFENARDGLLRMLWGYYLKIVLADRIAVVVDTVYGNFRLYPGWYLIVATVLFAFQIYCDFAGYSSIAVGAAKIIGVELTENFHAPYTSGSVSEFWKNWHITLSSWFRDYLYIPLGGNRKGRLRKYCNIMLVFVMSGLWHGANLHFLVWGGINGLFQIMGEILMPVRQRLIRLLKLTPDSLGFRLYRVVVTFCLVDFAWIFFRAERLQYAYAMIRSMLHADNPWILCDGSLFRLGLDEKDFRMMLSGLFVLIAADLCRRCKIPVREIIEKQDYPVRWGVIVFSVVFILTFGVWGPGYNAHNFIYFQF